MNRRQKRMMDRENRKEKKNGGSKTGSRSTGTSTPTGETVEPTGERKRVVAENGKVLIVDSVGNVFLEEESEDGEHQEFLLDVEEIQRPTVRDTMIFKLPGWVYRKTVGQVLGTSNMVDDGAVSEGEETDVVEQPEQSEQSSSAATSGKASRRRQGKRSQRS